jgi:hypothetical protein
MGVGRDPDDRSTSPRWHPIEDFRWDGEFSDFLSHINQEERSKVDLVLLGDVLELWQSLSEKDCHHESIDKNLGCREDEALARTQRVLDQHQGVLDKLNWFAGQGENRVTIVPGNHDVALAFPSVAEMLLRQIHAPADRLRIATEGYWWSADGKVIAEHGHQIGDDPNRFDGWPEHPFVERGGVRYLQKPWGEQMVQQIFNLRERCYPVLDNFSEEVQGVRYALRTLTLSEKLSSVGDGVRFILLQTSWAQTGQVLGTGGKAKEDARGYFDLDKLRKMYESAPERFLVDSIAPDDPLRGALEVELRAGRPVPGIHDLTEEEILSLCAQRRIYNSESVAKDKSLPECPTPPGLGTLGQALNDLLPGAKDKRLRDFLVCLKDGLPPNQRPTRLFTTFVYAHTHKEKWGYSPFPGTGPFHPEIWNDGAWQRRVTPQQFCSIARRKRLGDEEALLKIIPEDLPACYPFVRARWQNGRPDPEVKLLIWVQESGQKGESRMDCPFHVDPACEPKQKPKQK